MDCDSSKTPSPAPSVLNKNQTANERSGHAIIPVANTNIKSAHIGEVKTLNSIESHSSSSAKSSPWLRREYWGIALSLVSALTSSVGDLVVKYMEDFDTFTLATYHFQGMVLPPLCVCIFDKIVKKKQLMQSLLPITERENRNRFLFMIVGAVVGCGDVFLYFNSIQLMPLWDVKIISSCRPILVALVAHIFLGESCGGFQAAVSLLAIFGVGVISRHPMIAGESSYSSDEFKGAEFAAMHVLAVTIRSVIFRYLRTINVSVITLAFGVMGTITSISCSVLVEKFDFPATITEGILMVTLALAAYLSYTALALAMKYEPAAAVVTVCTCDMIFTFLLQYSILGHIPDWFSVIGAGLIGVCVLLMSFQRRI